MKNEDIIKHIKEKIPKEEQKNIRAVVMRNPGGYECDVMLNYSGGDGLGFMGSSTFLDVQYKNKASAEKLTSLINATFWKKERKTKKQDIWIAYDVSTGKSACDACKKRRKTMWYEGNPKGFGGDRRFVGVFCSNECAQASGKYNVV